MTKQNIKNIEHSIHDRLANKAREQNRTFNETLQHYTVERFLYRLYKSKYNDMFILKGALLLTVWGNIISRPTKDIDFLGKSENRVETIIEIMKEICLIKTEDDGVVFDESSVKGERIIENADYEGVRINLHGKLGNIELTINIDIGFGDIIVPEAKLLNFYTILDFPKPELYMYSKESTIAEKFQAFIKLGILSGRIKDLYEIWFLSKKYDFDCKLLAKAITKTFSNRKTEILYNLDVIIKELAEDKEKEAQWNSFIRRNKLQYVPENFKDATEEILQFLNYPVKVIIDGRKAEAKWHAGDKWVEG